MANASHIRKVDLNLFDLNDYVRLGISTALKHNIQVIPDLIKRAQMPMKNQLQKIQNCYVITMPSM
jgi:hypothetical protein